MNQLSDASVIATYVWVNIGSGNGLLPEGTKPLPKPMLTYHQLGSAAITWEQFHSECQSYYILFEISATSHTGQWLWDDKKIPP